MKTPPTTEPPNPIDSERVGDCPAASCSARRFTVVTDGDEASVFDHQREQDLFPTKSGNRDYQCLHCDIWQAGQIADAMEVYHLTMREDALYEAGDTAGARECRAQVFRICFDPCPPMPEHLKGEYLAPAIARGGDMSDAWESWRSQNPDACEHKWRWHATGAGMGWCCDKCDGYHAFKRDEDRPPVTGCISLPNS